MRDKKSFLLYFDAYPLLVLLPPEQRGHLLTAVYEYAMGIWREEDVKVESFLESRPELTADARMACGFLCANIRRDTEKWRQRWKRSEQAAREKKPETGQERGQEWMRKCVEQRRDEGGGPEGKDGDAWSYV